MEGAVLLCGHDTVTEETDAAGMEDDSTSTVLGVVHLSLTHTLTSQHHTVLIHHCTPTKIQQSWFAFILRDSVYSIYSETILREKQISFLAITQM